MLDTDQLRSFLAIVETGSFTRAAERVNKTQSAVSMHIRRLEERLDRVLFVKHGRGTRLTPDGERLVEHARRMLHVEAAALSDLGAHGLSGRVVLGIPDDYADTFLADIVERFTRQHPNVELSIVCLPSTELDIRVQTGEVDVAIVSDCDQIKGLEFLRIEPLQWVAGSRAGPIEEQRPLPLALSTPSCMWRRIAQQTLDAANVPWRIFLVSSNLAALAPIVQAGLAVTVLPASAVRPSMQRIVKPDDRLPPLPDIGIGLLKGSSGHSDEAAALADIIRARLRDPASPTPTAPGAGRMLEPATA